MRIGYMFWGFLGEGTIGTSDGGRGWRRALVDLLAARGHDVVFLQMDRDLLETGTDLAAPRFRWDVGRPDLDALVLEWRWPVAGRNTSMCGRPGHDCDLHRQEALLADYTDRGTPTVIWDLHHRLPADDPLRRRGDVVVCEPSPIPSPGAVTLYPPVADADLDTAGPPALTAVAPNPPVAEAGLDAAGPRDLHLVFVGDRHPDRDGAFAEFFAPAAKDHPHVVAGTWPTTDPWPWLQAVPRVTRSNALALHRRALATVLFAADHQARVGHVTHRLAEAVLTGCLPISPLIPGHPRPPTPGALHVASGVETSDLLITLAEAGPAHRADLLADCLHRLEPFRLSRQVAVLEDLLRR